MAQQPKQTKINNYNAILQPVVSLDDHTWSYNPPSLPSPTDTNRLGLVKTISLKTDGTKHTITLQLQPVSSNRALRRDPLDKFILISFANFHTRSLYNAAPTLKGTQPSTPRECADYMVKLLRAGITLQGVHYNFYGHSNSQLGSRSCFLYAASKDVIKAKVDALGEFGKMKTVQKKAKRIGLLFSSAEVARTVNPKWCEDIPDVETKDYVFTDGCGLIAPVLARELAKGAKIVFRNQRYCPSVFQIRYRGYKGVVTVDPRMREKGGPLLRMRKSMKKFAGGDDYSFSVVGSSKPYTFGHINDEVILLLHSLGISRETLLQKQQDHFRFLASASNDTLSAFRFLAYVNRFDLAEKVILESLDAVRSSVQRLIKDEHNKMINNRAEQRCRILIPQSRLLFGVCDAWDVLREGECHVRITHEAKGIPATLKNCDVVVTRNPCLHPGDLQKFKAVQKDELSHLVDCIVFSTRGKRPAADLMSGGDLDGDTFFVSWDRDIVPSTVSEAAEYPGAKEPISFKPITDDDRLVYFAKYASSSLGRTKFLYLDWARVKGPMSPECQQLNRLYSMCVDGNRIRIPPNLESAPKPPPDSPPFILDELHEAAKKIVMDWQWESTGSLSQSDVQCGDYTPETIEVLLSRQDLLVSEFELVQLTWRWCRENCSSLEDFAHFFDFTLLNAEQKQWVMSQLPPTKLYQTLVQNSLCQSHLLEAGELGKSKLLSPAIRWKRVFSSHEARMGGFMEAAAKAMELFHRKLIVYRVEKRLTLAIYVPMKLEKAKESRVDEKVRLLAFPHSQGEETTSRLMLPTKKNYQLYYDDNSFQLYENQRRNTWVLIGRGASDDNKYRQVESVGDQRRERQTTLDDGTNFDFVSSVDLKRFSSRLKDHLGQVKRNGVLGAEIYVISNRDTNSLRNLDLWNQHIDTRDVIPLFEQNPKEYTIATLGDVDWATQPEFIRQIVRRESLITLLMLDTKEQYAELFAFLLAHDQKELLIRGFDYLLSSFAQRKTSTLEPAIVVNEMLTAVTKCPVLAISFTRLESWPCLTEDVVDVLQANAEILLNAFVLAANTVGAAVIAPFQTVLARISILPIGTFGRLVELIALAVRSPELALDLLLGSLERESERLMPGRPAVVRHVVRNLIGIAMDHISEAAEQGKKREDLVDLNFVPGKDTAIDDSVIEAHFRIDARGGTPENSAHCRLTAAAPPTNALIGRVYSMDVLVISSTPGTAKFRCLHPPPPFLSSSSWKLTHCGPFVTSKTMIDAILELALDPTDSCPIAPLLTPYRVSPPSGLFLPLPSIHLPPFPRLNASQSSAVLASLTHPVTCLWGPPGTGKTETIVSILVAIRTHHPDVRLLVTAPTHNAVDNVMLRYLSSLPSDPPPLRVSTEVRKVSPLLLRYTVDALVGGEDIHSNRRAYANAKKQVSQATVVFSTCIGAGLGLLRGQRFGAVVVDEASQLTEPAAVVPLVKGCEKAVLVGDHVQLRPTVGVEADGVGFGVSLFERMFTAREGDGDGVARRMLDVQYRMHGDICGIVSGEFYSGLLKTGVEPGTREVGRSGFPWPVGKVTPGRTGKMVFVECGDPEDVGGKSKSNQGQARVCLKVCTLLSDGSGEDEGGKGPSEEKKASIAVLTPYTAQVALLTKLLAGLGPHVEVCSIDGFQGREAEVVVFVTVRSNPHQEIGFLKDRRRLNVALTRARRGVVLIGNEATLTMGTSDPESADLWKRLLGKMERVLLE
ncbi:RNA dependent RNA polymerase-domain-containing protein [Podospora conica]|nr:RNA dependent RNA polymerase-domain-containing protein [Schizothecium conicum]